jgi:schlafen family protein
MGEVWTEQKIQSHITGQIEESLVLDYKAAGALDRSKKNDITKDISSFANSAGGTVIYGVREFSGAKHHLPEKIDPIDRDQFDKEWLEHIIANIQPRLNVVIHPVQLASAPNHVAYVVEIPQGTTAHQATDFRYYKRYNFESVPMSDYEIRDVMQRKSSPKFQIEGAITFVPPAINSFEIHLWLLNGGRVSAHDIAFTADRPDVLNVDRKMWESKSQGDNKIRLVSMDPLHPEDRRRLVSYRIAAGPLDPETFDELRSGVPFNPKRHRVPCSEKLDVGLKVFARDLAPAFFKVQYSKREMESLKTKKFEPTIA